LLKKNKQVILLILLFMTLSFLFFYAGLFLFYGQDKPAKTSENTGKTVIYSHISVEIKGNKQEINILELNVKDKKLELKPILSYDSVFGFEKLSSMVERSKAYAGVNAGFFYEYGQPGGMVVIDGKMITNSTGRFPVFLYDGNKAEFKELHTKLWLTVDSKRFDVDGINMAGGPGKAVLYTREYGSDNRAETGNISAVIKSGRVVKVDVYPGKADIPESGMLLSLFGPEAFNLEDTGIKAGAEIQLHCDYGMDGRTQAYECGSWLIRDGRVVMGGWDEWVGVTTNQDPRTAIGVKDNGNVVLVTVDGRQPGYSTGMTGRELGEYLLGLGVVDAAMLDGGASTEMIVDGKIVNRPSFKGQERKLGGAIIVRFR
jgi:exopolysaccharide biosynthesis protein